MAEIAAHLKDKPIQRLKDMYAKQAEDAANEQAARQKILDENEDIIAENERWDHEHAQLEKDGINRGHILTRYQQHQNNLYEIEKSLFSE